LAPPNALLAVGAAVGGVVVLVVVAVLVFAVVGVVLAAAVVVVVLAAVVEVVLAPWCRGASGCPCASTPSRSFLG
jgi:hypothetical protein